MYREFYAMEDRALRREDFERRVRERRETRAAPGILARLRRLLITPRPPEPERAATALGIRRQA